MMTARSERRTSSLAVSSLIWLILVGVAFRWRCNSWTDTSSPSMVSPGHGLTRDNASATGMSFPGTYFISTSHFWILSIILAMRGGADEMCFLKINSNGLWSVSTVTCWP